MTQGNLESISYQDPIREIKLITMHETVSYLYRLYEHPCGYKLHLSIAFRIIVVKDHFASRHHGCLKFNYQEKIIQLVAGCIFANCLNAAL